MSSATQTSTASGSSARSRFKNRNAMLVLLFVGLLVVVFLIFILARATATEELHSAYGKRYGPEASDSVNGTNVLARMFDGRGFGVMTWSRLSPKLKNLDTIVWFPDRFESPSYEEREWLEAWLAEKPFRTLVYVGRDYDALTAYLEKMIPNAPEDQRERLQSRLVAAKTNFQKRRAVMQDEDAEWFQVKRGGAKRKVTSLQGEWSGDIDASKTWIEVQSQVTPPVYRDSHVLLESGQSDVLVMEVRNEYWEYESKIIVVTNGSFLLNVPLVNHEHRKLAAKLIDACGEPTDVAFVESGDEGLRVYEQEPKNETQREEDILTSFPLGAILMHWALLGVIVCYAVAPIFGTPRELRSDSQSDFGIHIDALGKTLSKAQDHAYSQQRLTHYQDKVRRDSGVAHADDRPRSGVLVVEIRLESATFASADESATRRQFEILVQQQVGKIVESASGLGKIEFAIEVADGFTARNNLRAILSQLHWEHRATITSK